jgi:hypothetical protein
MVNKCSYVGMFFLIGMLFGCARVPKTPITKQPRLLTVQFETKGIIDINDITVPTYYFVLINRTNNQNELGPTPVVSPPWGNAFGAAPPSNPPAQGFVAFVRYDRFQSGNNFGVYTCERGGVLQNPATFGTDSFPSLGQPDRAQKVNDNTLQFQIDLNRLPNPDARYIQINIVTTNALPQGTDNTTKKFWDAFGNGALGEFNNWKTYDVTQNATYQNSQSLDPEGAGDVRDRDQGIADTPARADPLDITNWSIELRR